MLLIISVGDFEGVVARPAPQLVRARAAVEQIGAALAIELIVASSAIETVVPRCVKVDAPRVGGGRVPVERVIATIAFKDRIGGVARGLVAGWFSTRAP